MQKWMEKGKIVMCRSGWTFDGSQIFREGKMKSRIYSDVDGWKRGRE